MSNEQSLKDVKGIKKTDVLSGATITCILTFILLTITKKIPPESAFFPYVTEQTISFAAGRVSSFISLLFSIIRYEVFFRVHERDYIKKINFLNKLIQHATCPKSKEELEQKKHKLLEDKANAILEKNL